MSIEQDVKNYIICIILHIVRRKAAEFNNCFIIHLKILNKLTSS